jgi:hypothetical protein
MPVPRLLDYSVIRWNAGYSLADHIIRPILEPQMYNSRIVNPDPRRPGLADRYHHRLSGTRFDLKFGTELRGRPAAAAIDTELPDGDLWHAVGFDGFANTATSYQYALDNIHLDTLAPPGDLTPVDIQVYHDGIHAGSGVDCVGNVRFRFPANDICTCEWEFVGQNGGALKPTVPPETTPAVNENIGAIILGNNATISFTPAGGGAITTLCVRDLTIDLKNTALLRPCIAQQYGFAPPVLPDRDVTVSGVIEAPLIATADFEDLVDTRVIITLAATFGTVVNSIFTFAMKFTLNQMPDLVNIDNTLGYGFEGKMDPSGLLTCVIT